MQSLLQLESQGPEQACRYLFTWYCRSIWQRAAKQNLIKISIQLVGSQISI